jgi:ATP-dependent Clp protease ATP-binding subunit ClpA
VAADMFVIGPGFGSFAMLQNIKDFDMKAIEDIYEKVEQGQNQIFQVGMKETSDYITNLFKARHEKQLKAEAEQQDKLRAESAINNPVTGQDMTAKPIENKG